MTEKKIGIINSALELFADQGIKSTTTNQIAKKAMVSEGLIFRHFQNKNGLIRSVVENAFERIAPYAQDIEDIQDPKQLLSAIIDLPAKLLGDEPTYWKLQMSVKFQHNIQELMELCDVHSPPLYEMAVEAFQKLKYDDPENEALLFHMAIEGIIFQLVYKPNGCDLNGFTEFLKSKYDLR